MTRYAVPFLTALLLLAGAGCDNSGVVDSGARDGELGSEAFAVVNAEDAFANIEDATFVVPMVMNPVFSGGHFFRHPSHPRRPGSHLRAILRELDLSREQIDEIRALIRAHREEIQLALQGLREVNLEILEAAEAERQEILDQLEAGEITAEEAQEMIHALNHATREAIRNNPANQPFLDAICQAKRDLLEAIGAILDPDQKSQWDDWVSTLQGDCFSDAA